MRTILVPVADRPECAVALAGAFEFADRLGANVVGCHIRPHRSSKVQKSPNWSQPVAGAKKAWENNAKVSDQDARSQSARQLLESAAQKYGMRIVKRLSQQAESLVVWQERVGSPDRVLSILGPVSDMLVVSRPQEGSNKLAKVFLLEAILRSARPVLIVPQHALNSIGKRPVIAWNQSHEAMRSVVAALPILAKAESVTIASIGKDLGLGPGAKDLVKFLKLRGIKACVKHLPKGKPEQLLLDVYSNVDADLLLMGAFSRSRLRQWLFGGVTDYMLHKADIPVLMLHS